LRQVEIFFVGYPVELLGLLHILHVWKTHV